MTAQLTLIDSKINKHTYLPANFTQKFMIYFLQSQPEIQLWQDYLIASQLLEIYWNSCNSSTS